ncbi:MAG: hypothetical protein ACREYE_03200 [Gammaproteobacteria bacterium]
MDELYGIMRLRAFKSTGFPVNILAENDGTVRSQVILHDGTVQTRARSETNGSLITSLYGKSAGTLTSVKVEATGEIDYVIHGKDSAGPNIDALLTDPNRILWSRAFREPILQNGVLLAATATTIYTCPASTIVEEIWVEVTSNDDTNRTVDLFVDFDGTGVATTETILDTVTLIGNAEPRRFGPYSLQATGTVRGLCSNANSATARVFGWTRPSTP